MLDGTFGYLLTPAAQLSFPPLRSAEQGDVPLPGGVVRGEITPSGFLPAARWLGRLPFRESTATSGCRLRSRVLPAGLPLERLSRKLDHLSHNVCTRSTMVRDGETPPRMAGPIGYRPFVYFPQPEVVHA